MMLLWIDLDDPWCIYVHRDIFPRIDYVQRPAAQSLGIDLCASRAKHVTGEVLLEEGNGVNTPSLFM